MTSQISHNRVPAPPPTSYEYKANVYAVAALFQKFFTVPVYQRGYAWSKDQIEDLFWDVYRNAYIGEAEHLLGSIITTTGASGDRELIDGQQRITTLWLFQAALRSQLAACNEETKALTNALRDVSDDSSGKERELLRLRAPFNKGDEVLEAILATKPGAELAWGDTSHTGQVAIVKAFNTFLGLLAEHCPDSEDLKNMQGALRHRVKLVELEAASTAQALLLFETTNNRGLPLSPSDLVKNFVFANTDDAQYSCISSSWSTMVSDLKEAKVDVSAFLRYVALGRYQAKLRESEIAAWFGGNREDNHVVATQVKSDAVGFAVRLAELAACLKNIRNKKTPRGTASQAFEELHLLGVKQALPVLLATADWSDAAAEVVAKELTDFFFVASVVRLRGQEVEKLVGRWVKVLYDLGSSPTPAAVQKAFCDASDPELPRSVARREGEKFVAALGDLMYDSPSVRNRIRFFLRHAAAWLSDADRWNGLGSLASNLEIEHVLSQTPSEAAVLEFKHPVTARDFHGLGNLCLLEKSHNGKAGNDCFSAKASTYQASGVLLTRSLVAANMEGLPKADRARLVTLTDVAPGLQTYEPWTRESQERRLTGYREIARKIWL